MAKTIASKLRIQPGNTLLSLSAPASFKKGLSPLPVGVKIITKGSSYNQVHWFISNKTQLEKEVSKVLKLLKPGVIVWAYYPKTSSGIQTDLTRDKGWDCLLEEYNKLTWISLVSFDETWSVFGFRSKTDTDQKKKAVPQKREILNWVNPSTKEVRLPAELILAFKKNRSAASFFESLSFTNKKEYVEWIVTAKREETKNERLAGTVERLNKGWKNPRNL